MFLSLKRPNISLKCWKFQLESTVRKGVPPEEHTMSPYFFIGVLAGILNWSYLLNNLSFDPNCIFWAHTTVTTRLCTQDCQTTKLGPLTGGDDIDWNKTITGVQS